MFLYHHLGCTVIFILHVIANYPEVRLRPPARLDLAAARQPMALTLEEHVVVEGLKESREKRVDQTEKQEKSATISKKSFKKTKKN